MASGTEEATEEPEHDTRPIAPIRTFRVLVADGRVFELHRPWPHPDNVGAIDKIPSVVRDLSERGEFIEVLGTAPAGSSWAVRGKHPSCEISRDKLVTLEQAYSGADMAELLAERVEERQAGQRGAVIEGEELPDPDERPRQAPEIFRVILADGRVFEAGQRWPHPLQPGAVTQVEAVVREMTLLDRVVDDDEGSSAPSIVEVLGQAWEGSTWQKKDQHPRAEVPAAVIVTIERTWSTDDMTELQGYRAAERNDVRGSVQPAAEGAA